MATYDLEIRGAGELLGDEQSGQIQSIGFSLYMEMLEKAVKALKEGKEPVLDELIHDQTDIELRIPALLPDTYIHDVNMRLSLYKRIASTENSDDLHEMKVELIERFGLLPEATENLLKIQEIKQQAHKLGIKKIEGHERGGMIEFSPHTKIDPLYLIQLIQSQSDRFKLENSTKLKLVVPLIDRRERIEFIVQTLNDFGQHLVKN